MSMSSLTARSPRSVCAARNVALIAPTEVPAKMRKGGDEASVSPSTSTIPANTPTS
jgi:hypothetical protein